MNNPFFSIIIPAHNSAEYITKGLNSIKAQTFTDYEIIVPCDRCTDNTKAVALSYGAVAFDVENGQDGLTRNAGLDVAQGEWVLFLDDDDWFLHEYVFQQLADMVGKHGEDALCFSIISKDEWYVRQEPDNGLLPCVWSKCWRRSFISDVRFSWRRFWSDSDFHNKALRKSHKYVYWDMPIYYYNRQRKGSQSAYAQQRKWDWLAKLPANIRLTDPSIFRKGE